MHEAWATSPDNAVSVLAVAGGVPVEVRLTGTAMRLPADALARSVLATAARAGRQAADRLHQELAASVGPEATRTLERVGLTAPQPDPPPHPADDPDDPSFGRVLWSAR